MMNNQSLALAGLRRTKLQKRNMPITLNQKGSVLLEALIAILIFSFGILAISGLQGAMMKNTADATFRSEASYAVQQELGNILVNPLGIGAGYPKPVAGLPNGQIAMTPLTNGRIQFKVTWDAGDGANSHQYEAITSVFTAR